jgi:mycothiol synthase
MELIGKSDWNRNGYETRSATLDDVDRIVDLINAAELADTGMVATNREEKLIEWGLPQFEVETDTLLVLEPGGRAVGFVELWDSKPHVRPYQMGRVHPDYRGRGIGQHLMAWAEERARQSLGKAPPEARVCMRTSTVHGNDAAHELFGKSGFTVSRHFYWMLIEMSEGEPPPDPTWPAGVSVRPYAMGHDDRAVHEIINEAFKDHWGFVEGETFEEWFHWLENDPGFDPSTCFLAVTHGGGGEELVGVLMSRSAWEHDPAVAWIDELGVLRAWRRQGIGLGLLHQVFGEYYRRGKYKVGLGVDAHSLTGATRLYETAGMRVFRRFDAYEKELRPGLELCTESLEA